jgi:hypothetical protein
MRLHMVQSTPSPLRGGVRGGGAERSARSMFRTALSTPTSIPPLKGEGGHGSHNTASIKKTETV